MKRALLITGASSEVGRILMEEIWKEYDVIFAHYNKGNEKISSLISRLNSDNIIPVEADFMDYDSTVGLIDRIKDTGYYPCEIVHLASPRLMMNKFKDIPWERFKYNINASLRPVMLILKEFLPRMVKLGKGRIVFMLSSNTAGIPAKYQSDYVTSKYALMGFMKSIAAEYAGKGISINAVSPEMMETEFISNVPDRAVYLNAQGNPLGRNIRVEEIIPAIKFLLSDSAVAMTGQNILITGGR